MSNAALEDCLKLKKKFNSTLADYSAEASKWKTKTGYNHAVPSYAPTDKCAQLEINYMSLIKDFNNFNEKIRKYDEGEIKKVEEKIENEKNKQDVLTDEQEKKFARRKKEFDDRMDQVDKFLNDDSNNSQSAETRMKTAIEHLKVLRDLTTSSEEFPDPWEVPQTHIELPAYNQPIGGTCTCD